MTKFTHYMNSNRGHAIFSVTEKFTHPLIWTMNTPLPSEKEIHIEQKPDGKTELVSEVIRSRLLLKCIRAVLSIYDPCIHPMLLFWTSPRNWIQYWLLWFADLSSCMSCVCNDVACHWREVSSWFALEHSNTGEQQFLFISTRHTCIGVYLNFYKIFLYGDSSTSPHMWLPWLADGDSLMWGCRGWLLRCSNIFSLWGYRLVPELWKTL